MQSDTEKSYISLAEASKFCSYSQEYLSLRARQGKLQAIKQGRNWVTTKDWLKDYNNEIGGAKELPDLSYLANKIRIIVLVLVLGLGVLKIGAPLLHYTGSLLVNLGESIEEQGAELAPAALIINLANISEENDILRAKVTSTLQRSAGYALKGLGQGLQAIGNTGQDSGITLSGLDNHLEAGLISAWQGFESNLKRAEQNAINKITNFFKPGAKQEQVAELESDILEKIDEVEQGLESAEEQLTEIQSTQEEVIVRQPPREIIKQVEYKIVSTEVVPAEELAKIDSELAEIRGLAQNANQQVITEHRIVETIGTNAIGVADALSVGGSTYLGNTNSSTDVLSVYADATFDAGAVFNQAVDFNSSVTFDASPTFNATTTFAGILPGTDDTYDIGSSTAEWRNIYIDGIANIDDVQADSLTTASADINGGNIDGTIIGAATTAAGTFSDLTSSSLTTTGNVSLTGTSIDIGDTASDLLTITSHIDSHILPDASNTRDLGSSALRWRTGYFDSIDASNITGTVETGSTNAATWTINADNATANAEIASLAFETGTAAFNAVMQWNASGNGGQVSGYDDNFLLNYPLSVFSEVSGANQTFTSGSIFNYGQNSTHAITQSGALIGLDIDFSSNITGNSQNQTGIFLNLQDSGTSIGLDLDGAADFGIDMSGATLTSDIRLANSETIDNATNNQIALSNGTNSIIFDLSGPTITTGTNQDLTLDANGTGKTILSDSVQFDAALDINNNIDLDNSSANIAVDITQTGDAVALTVSQADADKAIATFSKSITNANASGNPVTISYSGIVTDAGTYTKAGTILALSNAQTETSGTITDSAVVLSVTQSGDTGDAVVITNSGTGNSLTIDTNAFIVDSSGNVGLGTTSPSGKLDVRGQCVTGDTLLPIVGQGEVQIKDIKGGEYVLSLNEKTGQVEPARIKGLLDMGIQPIYQLETEDGKTIRTTGNHPYLALSEKGNIGQQESNQNYTKGNSYTDIDINNVGFISHNDNFLKANAINKQSIPYNISKVKAPKFSRRFFSEKLGTINTAANQPADKLTNNSERIADHIQDNNTKWIEVYKLKAGDKIAVASDDLQSVKFVKIERITQLPPEQVYDIEVEGTHNFIGNGIFAHNTYITDADPSIILDVSTATDTDFWLGVQDDADSVDDDKFQIGDGTTPGTNPFLTIDTSGNVGIGTTAPGAALEIGGSGRIFVPAGSAAAPSYSFSSDTDSGFYIVSDELAWATSGAERLRMRVGAMRMGTAYFEWGIDTANADTNLYRSSANVLKTDDDFIVGGGDITLVDGGTIGIGGAKWTFDDTNDDISTSGNVGIGTTSPLTLLDVAGSGRIKGTATSVLTGTIDPAASTTVTGVGTLFTTELVVGDRITVTGETRTVTAIATNTSLTVDTAFTDNANDTSPDKLAAELIVKDSSDNIDFIIQDNGNVGIGTTGPGVELHIHDGTTGGASYLQMTQDTTGAGSTAGFLFGVTSDEEVGFNNRENTDMFFLTNGVEAMRIDNSGNVGIGTTGPGDVLHIYHGGPEIRYEDSDGGDVFRVGNVGGKFRIYNNNDTRADVLIDGDGKMGIGTATPLSGLHLTGGAISDSPTVTGVHLGMSGNYAAMQLYGSSGGFIDFSDGSGEDADYRIIEINGKLEMRAGTNTNSVTIDSTGNVGIGTTGPGAKLDVRGDVKVGVVGTGHDVNYYSSLSSYTRFLWDESKGALRVGLDGLSDFDAPGKYSFSAGTNNDASGENSVAFGKANVASGFSSIAMGQSTTASGELDSIAMGFQATASGTRSVAIGRYVTAGTANYNMVLGNGVDGSNRLVNNIENSLMVGFNSNIPTLFVGPSSGAGTTGNVGIGTTSPSAKLDVVGTGTFGAAGVSGLEMAAHTVTLSGANPTTYATFREVELGAITLAGTNLNQTVTTASSLYIANPVAGTNVTITNNYPIDSESGGYLTSAGVWTDSSSQELKENFTELDRALLLDQIMSLELREYNYIIEGPDIKHFGATAEDFYGIFGWGNNDKSISAKDVGMLALAGVQELAKLNIKEENNKIISLDNRLFIVENKVDVLEQKVDKLTNMLEYIISEGLLSGSVPMRLLNDLKNIENATSTVQLNNASTTPF